uniref:Uncharacterized protein n=1 Tax=Solanum lycopersicum TaxID=4081 RepID=K4C0R6_SOLLC
MEAPPIKQEGSSSSHGGVTIYSIYYYGKLVYQDVNLRSYFGLIRPPTRLTFRFRLGRIENDIAFLIENDDSLRKTNIFKFFSPKKSHSNRPTSHLLRRTLRAVRPSLNYSVIQYLLNTKKKMHFDPVVVLNHFVAPGVAEQSTMGGSNASRRSLDKGMRFCIAFFVESSTIEKKCLVEDKKRRTTLFAKRMIFASSIHGSGSFKPLKYARIENDIAFLVENDDSFRKTNLFKFFFPKKSRSDRPTSHLLKRTLFAVLPSLNYLVIQYLFNTKKKMHFDPIVVLNQFVAPGVAEQSSMGGANAQGRSLDKSIRSCIDSREQLLGQLRRKCWNLIGKDKVIELIEKFINLNRIGELIRGIEMMIEIILRNI